MNDLPNALRELSDEASRTAPHTAPADLWARGRRARRTQRLALGSAVAAVVLLVLATGGVVRPLASPLPADVPEVPDGGALPKTVYAPTYPASDWSPGPGFNEDELVTDLAVGRVSVAWARWSYAPLLVSAETGEHLLVQLPDTDAFPPGAAAPLALSPDGTKLAYPWWRLAKTTDASRAGIGLVDLITGEVDQYPLRGRNDRPVNVQRLSWSPDSTHVAWIGDEAVQWDEGGSGFKGRVVEVGVWDVGQVHPSTVTIERGGRIGAAVAVTDDGVVSYLADRRLWTLFEEGSDEGPANRVVADEPASWGPAVMGGSTLYVARDRDLMALDLTRRDPRPQRVPWRGTGASAQVDPLGTTPDGSVVAAIYREKNFTSILPPEVALRARDGRVRTLIRWDSSTYVSISVATDLADRPPVAFPEPRWPISDERKAVLAGLGLGLVAAAAWLVRLVLRRRREHPAPP